MRFGHQSIIRNLPFLTRSVTGLRFHLENSMCLCCVIYWEQVWELYNRCGVGLNNENPPNTCERTRANVRTWTKPWASSRLGQTAEFVAAGVEPPRTYRWMMPSTSSRGPERVGRSRPRRSERAEHGGRRPVQRSGRDPPQTGRWYGGRPWWHGGLVIYLDHVVHM